MRFVGEPLLSEVRAKLLDWYDANRRDLPWRRTRDPYQILVAEYLLQRTRIASGIPYFERFVRRFPSLRDLANASLDEVLAQWEGLGFYGRARNLHAAARAILDRFSGEVPHSYDELESLPGMGPYTAGAVASIAFGLPVAAVDGNVTRVISRLFRVHEAMGGAVAHRRIKALADRLVPSDRPGEFNQALMDLGATICTPTSPACDRCPLERDCLARAAGEEQLLPIAHGSRSPPVIPVAFALLESNGRVLLRRRPPGALLGGLWSLPGGEISRHDGVSEALAVLVHEQTGLTIDVGPECARADRVFSHRKWSGAIYRCIPRRPARNRKDAQWVTRDEALRLPVVPFHRTAIERVSLGLE
ncbi:MAG TPA: A/G-specific adenine glycosylase, partial [Thermoplasmata archaeon]|nr:A/G-specific adenine glycosylase [Thermoplasmata archaeon]